MRRLDLIDPSPHELLSRVPARLDPDAMELLAAPGGDGREARPTLESHGTTCSPSCSSPASSAPTTVSSITSST